MNPPPPLPSQNIPVPLPKKNGFFAWLSKPLVMVCAMGLLGFLAIAAFIGIYFLSARDFTPTTAQKACIVTADELANEFVMTVDPSAETWSAQRYLDGSMEIDYEYDDPSPSMIYINCSLSVDASVSDAKYSFGGYWQGMKLGTKIGGGASVDIETANHIFKWGDASRFAFLKSGGSRYALVFVTRKGRKVFYLTIANALLEDPAEIDAFLQPFLERFDREHF
ncbi:MAG: hypothetical protein VCA73_08790 [Roseibacillus sp.]|jgi:hypothetical protein